MARRPAREAPLVDLVVKLFKIELDPPRGRNGRVVVVHAEEEEDALAHIRTRLAGWTVTRSIEIVGEAHFTVALLEPD